MQLSGGFVSAPLPQQPRLLPQHSIFFAFSQLNGQGVLLKKFSEKKFLCIVWEKLKALCAGAMRMSDVLVFAIYVFRPVAGRWAVKGDFCCCT